ncbi:hypothetical protein [Tunturiibacter gelidiferens]|uniref:hypothetical protein n=1 Tax=Tunturiibacter gelidiferens TaxID=3069689 RepID=UPI003D9ABF71
MTLVIDNARHLDKYSPSPQIFALPTNIRPRDKYSSSRPKAAYFAAAVERPRISYPPQRHSNHNPTTSPKSRTTTIR